MSKFVEIRVPKTVRYKGKDVPLSTALMKMVNEPTFQKAFNQARLKVLAEMLRRRPIRFEGEW